MDRLEEEFYSNKEMIRELVWLNHGCSKSSRCENMYCLNCGINFNLTRARAIKEMVLERINRLRLAGAVERGVFGS